MKLAAIDIGTNSMRLLITDYEKGEFSGREKYVNTTRIGQGVDENGYINDEAIKRNIDALCEFSKLARDKSCQNIWAMGTSALRDSKNGDEFVSEAYEKTGVQIEIINGDMEANMGFIGVMEGIGSKSDNILVLDIGGGSTEFVVGNRDGIRFMKSENVGALRMTEKFLKTDPIDETEYKAMEMHIDSVIEDTIDTIKKYNIKNVVGIGGTITTLSSMVQELEIYDMKKTHNSIVDIIELQKQIEKLKKLTSKEKKCLKGLHPKRADIISAGFAILHRVLCGLGFSSIAISEYDNLEGLIAVKTKA